MITNAPTCQLNAPISTYASSAKVQLTEGLTAPVNKRFHWDKWPKYARDLIWDDRESPWLTTALATLTDKPVPNVPENEWNNETALKTI